MAGKPDPRRRPPQDRGPRINHQIRIRQVRVIDEDNEQLGVMETADALAVAVKKNLDLVEIAPNQRPPVVRIMDFGKFKYEEKKKEQASRRKQHQVQVKELRVRPGTGEHDLLTTSAQQPSRLHEGTTAPKPTAKALLAA